MTSAPTARPFGVLGGALALLGTTLLVVAFTALDWLEPTSLSIDFGELNHAADAAGSTWLAAAYFSWLGWLLLVVAVALAAASTVLDGLVAAVAGTVVGLGAAAVTVFALKLSSGTSLGDYVGDAGAGYWAAILGFVVLAGASAAGLYRPQPASAASRTSSSEMPSTNSTVSR